ncbi:CbiX/SirB N-terminal domain-containing protein [Streptomyces chumphonensis]|uniref:Sirohydrochlorin chelatase n=1 Tax=Streptomyces chumphonensis TaxID=1214925 RepID=A0A927EW20_9ACTN|nr:sirohydrochlorin chelatase [Streptomyces chumphonensis]MBD3930633.1 sirohydrochlorin chelatase [Streptomyces chumphonensis]
MTATTHRTPSLGPPRPDAPTDAPTLVAVAHGSRDPRALTTVQALLAEIRAQRPGLRVELGHIELAAPLLGDTLAAHAPGDVVLVPLLLGRGHHVGHDLPRAADAAPHLRSVPAAALGPHPLLAEALHARLTEARGRRHGPPDAVVLAAAGSRDPRSAADAEHTAALLSRRLGGTPVRPAYATAATPTVPRAVAALRAAGHRRIALASYFTAPGHFATRCARAAGPGVPAAPPLGAHPALARLVLHRYDEARVRARPALSALPAAA